MKRLFFMIMCVLIFTGCQDMKHMGRSITASTSGYNYHIVLYANNGSIIKEWHTNTSIQDEGSIVSFFDKQNNVIHVEGTVLVEQE